MSNPRRKFLKSTAKAGAVAAVAGVAISACSKSEVESKNLTRGKSKKQEVLYQSSKYWEAYYKVAY